MVNLGQEVKNMDDWSLMNKDRLRSSCLNTVVVRTANWYQENLDVVKVPAFTAEVVLAPDDKPYVIRIQSPGDCEVPEHFYIEDFAWDGKKVQELLERWHSPIGFGPVWGMNQTQACYHQEKHHGEFVALENTREFSVLYLLAGMLISPRPGQDEYRVQYAKAYERVMGLANMRQSAYLSSFCTAMSFLEQNVLPTLQQLKGK